MRQIAEFLRRYVPGFEKSYVAQSGVQVGVRETRRVLGDYQLTADDVLAARKFGDAVARGAYPIDIHNPTGSGTVLKRLPPGEAYDIPLRCLMPKEVEGLLVAGRCMSGLPRRRRGLARRRAALHSARRQYRLSRTAPAGGAIRVPAVDGADRRSRRRDAEGAREGGGERAALPRFHGAFADARLPQGRGGTLSLR